jgi:hypothetical protein
VSSKIHFDSSVRPDRVIRMSAVECVKSCKLIMGPVKPSPRSHPRSPRPDRASEVVAERGVASIPLVDLSEPQAAVFNLSRCASFRNAMLR